MPGEETGAAQSGKRLLDATRPFAMESPIKSWWHVGSTLVVLGAALVVAAVAEWWLIRIGASVLGGLVLVRAFILYHDFMHHALLRDSRFAKAVFYLFGLLLLTPPRYWRYSHNFHHGNVGKVLRPDTGPSLLVTSDIGSFPLMTTDAWQETSIWQRLRYRVTRHPLTLLFACVTVFLFSLCLLPLLRDPRKYWDSALSLIAHGTLVAGIWTVWGFPMVFFTCLLPFAIASAIGAYLFYAQHNYEGMRILKPEEWTYYRGATESSSHMKLGPLMHWFTGNIGYHHVHHLNPLIPFYRLPEAMAAVPELQHAQMTSLRTRDILTCLRLNLWDAKRRRLVSYHDVGKAA